MNAYTQASVTTVTLEQQRRQYKPPLKKTVLDFADRRLQGTSDETGLNLTTVSAAARIIKQSDDVEIRVYCEMHRRPYMNVLNLPQELQFLQEPEEIKLVSAAQTDISTRSPLPSYQINNRERRHKHQI